MTGHDRHADGKPSQAEGSDEATEQRTDGSPTLEGGELGDHDHPDGAEGKPSKPEG